MKRVWIGCAGWSYKEWREDLYKDVPQANWLRRYSEEFSTVEVNSTFYRLPSEKAVAAWVDQTPDDFVFSVKASRYQTHIKRLRTAATGVERFYPPLKAMIDAGKLGPTLWQLPANFERDDERLAEALGDLPPGRHCFEFRHPSWFVPATYEALRKHGAALVIGDHRERPFQTHELTTSWTYIRFHYGSRGRNGNYSQAEIDEWASRIAAWARTVEVFAYFNNDWSGFAFRNARRLRASLGDGV